MSTHQVQKVLTYTLYLPVVARANTDALVAQCGGYTLTRGEGYWIDPSTGEVAAEQVARVEFLVNDPTGFDKVLREFTSAFFAAKKDEKCLMYTVSGQGKVHQHLVWNPALPNSD